MRVPKFTGEILTVRGGLAKPEEVSFAVDPSVPQDEAREAAMRRAHNRARAAAKARIAPLAAEAIALYTPIADEYDAGYKAGTLGALGQGIHAAQSMANAIRWGSICTFAKADALVRMGVSDIVRGVETGRVTDYERAAVEMAERVDMLRALLAAWQSR